MKQEPESGEFGADQHPGELTVGQQAVFLLRNEALASALPPIVAVDERGRIVFASDGVRESLGWDPGELPGKRVSVLLPGDPDERELDRLIKRLVARPREAFRLPRVFNAARRDGAILPFELTVSRVHVPERGGHVLFGILRDVSKRVTAETRLRSTEQTLQLCLEAASMGAFEWDADSGRLVWDDRHHALFGFDKGEEVRRGEDALDTIFQEDRERVADALRVALEGGERFDIEYRVPTHDGGVRWLATVGQRDRAPSGRTRLIGVTSDITRHRLSEESLTRRQGDLERELLERSGQLDHSNAQLRVADRMVAIGTLAAGLGHDMGNVLLPVRAHLNAAGVVTQNPLVVDHLDAIGRSIGYLQQLADGLQSMASEPETQAGRTPSTDIHSWWSRVGPLLVKALPKHIGFREDLPPDIPRVALQEHQLTQAVLNLVVNAGEAIGNTPTGGKEAEVLLRAREVRSDARHEVEICVADNGPGMTDHVRRHALDMFFTTKQRGMGTGLGLTLARSVVERAGGSVEIDSKLGRGTSVSMRLPACRSEQATGKAGRPVGRAGPAGSRKRVGKKRDEAIRVLCVDDHALLIEGLKAQFGLDDRVRVVGALASAEGLVERVRELRPDIVLLDIEMPGPDAFEAADRLRRTCPEARVVVLSAHIRDGYLASARRCGASGYFAKSDSLEDIVDGIVRVANSGGAGFVMGPKVRRRFEERGDRGEADGVLPIQSLTSREVEVLRLIGKGLTRTQIAAELSRSPKTIDGHQSSIIRKLGAEGRADLVRLAIREGFAEA